jgi:hypothetical protein
MRCSKSDGRPRLHVQLLLETNQSLSDGQLVRYKHAAPPESVLLPAICCSGTAGICTIRRI